MDIFLKIVKITALLIPSIISIIVLVIVLLSVNESITDMQTLDLKINMGISIIGIAISVWVGLNIYNLIEKKEVDELNLIVNNSINKLQEIEPKIKEFEIRMEEDEKCRYFLLLNQSFSDRNERIKSLMKSNTYQKLYHNFNKYIIKFEELVGYNSKLLNPYPINHTTYIRTCTVCVISFIENKDKYISLSDIITSEPITICALEEKIDNAFNSIKSILNNIDKRLLQEYPDIDSMVFNYSELKSYLQIIKDKAAINNLRINSNKIDELSTLFIDIIDLLKAKC